MTERVERFGVFEAWFRCDPGHAHPYRDIQAQAVLRGPDGRERRVALFWYREDVWGLRYSPDATGTWEYRVESGVSALDGLSGHFECLAGVRQGGLTVMPGYPGHLALQDGTPVWLLGDTQWRSFATDPTKGLDRHSMLHYLDVREAQGFNYVHADLMSGVGIDGEQRVFLDYAEERPNTAYFDEVDARIRAMNARHITAGLLLAWSRGADSWETFLSDDARLRYARYVVARYSAMNVVFVVAGEWDLETEAYAGRYERIGEAIRDADPHGRLRAIHAGRGRTVQRFGVQEWMSFGDYQQMYCAPYDREATAAERRALHNRLIAPSVHGKPVVNAEYAYYLRDMSADRSYWREPVPGVDKQHSHTRESFRRASWVLAMAGGYFVTGFGTTYYGGWRNAGPFDVDDPRNDPAEQDLMYLAGLFRSLQWWRMTAMDGLVQSAEGQAYCLAELGNQYLVYAEGTLRARLLLEGEPQVRFDVERLNPRTGERRLIAGQVEAASLDLDCPDRDDWAFVVRIHADRENASQEESER